MSQIPPPPPPGPIGPPPVPPPPPIPGAVPPSGSAVGTMSAQEIEAGKTMALLCYVMSFLGLPLFIAPLVMRDNEFSLYHAKQNLILWIAAMAVSIVCMIVAIATCGIGAILFFPLGIGLVILGVMGLVAAMNGRAEPLPMIGTWGEQWFAGITKVAK